MGGIMAGLLSGLEQFGLGGLEGMNLYEKEASEEIKQAVAPSAPSEQDFLFDKTQNCPICDCEFKSKTVKIGKAKLIGTDLDLRPKYENIDMLKYRKIRFVNLALLLMESIDVRITIMYPLLK